MEKESESLSMSEDTSKHRCRKRDSSVILEDGKAQRMEEVPEANRNETLKWHWHWYPCCPGEIHCSPGLGGGCCPRHHPVCCKNGVHCHIHHC